MLATPASIYGQCAHFALGLECPACSRLEQQQQQQSCKSQIRHLRSQLSLTKYLSVINFTYFRWAGWWTGGQRVGSCPFPQQPDIIMCFKRPYYWKYLSLTPEWIKLSSTGVNGMVVIYCIQSSKRSLITNHHPLLHSTDLDIRKRHLLQVFLN
jgi:hypothetical protein